MAAVTTWCVLLGAPQGGCVAVGDIMADQTETFRPARYEGFTRAGSNTLEGRAVSDATTERPGPCAGDVSLIPDGLYMNARAPKDGNAHLSTDDRHERGLAYAGDVTSIEAAYLERKTRCDPDGRFRFEALPDGPYIVYATAADGRNKLYRRVRLWGAAA
jgi:hypothetical protein